MANIGNIVWLINGDPKFHFVAKTVKNEVRIIPEFDNDSLVLPASNILQSLWKVPVVESNLTAKENQLSIIEFEVSIAKRFMRCSQELRIHEVGCLQQAMHPQVCGSS